MKQKTSARLAALLLAFALLLTSCGGGTTAATMRLRRTEGTVGVSDGEGRDVAVVDDLGLYSGYQVGTQAESYAWIDLDSVKLTKMDADSEVEVIKDGKKLELNVKSGSLFFNVTQPLADDETMNIRTSTMVVGIRGTCGWVAEDSVALLKGVVSVTAGEQEATVSAGETAVLTEEGTLEVRPLTSADVPAFVKAEVEEADLPAEETEAPAESGTPDEEAEPPAESGAPDAVDPIYRRDMYTYSKLLTYNADGELTTETECLPDEQGRIAKTISKPAGKSTGDDAVTVYEYNDAGTLAGYTIDRAINNGVLVHYTVTEDTADHRTKVNEQNNGSSRVYTEYYDAHGRLIRQEDVMNGSLFTYSTYEYDAEGKLVRTDHYQADGSPIGYALYEYD